MHTECDPEITAGLVEQLQAMKKIAYSSPEYWAEQILFVQSLLSKMKSPVVGWKYPNGTPVDLITAGYKRHHRSGLNHFIIGQQEISRTAL